MNFNPFTRGALMADLDTTADRHVGFSNSKLGSILVGMFSLAFDPRHTRKILTLTPLVAAAGNSDDDSLFNATELANVVRDSGGTALLRSLTILSKGALTPLLDIVFFRAAVTSFGAADAAAALDDTDMVQLIGTVPIVAADWIDVGVNTVATKLGIDLILEPTGTSIWVAAVVGVGGVTPASTSEFILRFSIEN